MAGPQIAVDVGLAAPAVPVVDPWAGAGMVMPQAINAAAAPFLQLAGFLAIAIFLIRKTFDLALGGK